MVRDPLHIRYRQMFLLLVRFGLVGMLNTAFGYAVYAVFVVAGIAASLALVLATILGAAFNFYTARNLVFGRSGRVMRFVVLYGVVLLANMAALRAVRAAGIAALPAQAMLALPMAALSFAGQRLWVFSRDTAP